MVGTLAAAGARNAACRRPVVGRMSDDVPAGFAPLARTSPFLDLTGPFFSRRDDAALCVAFRVAPQHVNGRGFAHGGVLATLADVALGYAAAFSVDPPAALLTTHLDADFAGAARIGDWVEARVDVQHVGSRLAFANAYLCVGNRRIVRASAVFAREPATVLPGDQPSKNTSRASTPDGPISSTAKE